jgi:polyisoprenoid-binding protein YceI
MASPGQVTTPELQALLDGQALAGSWVLDAARSAVGLRSKSMWGMAPVTGTVTVAAASIDTKNKKRDVHLRSADFFDSDKYPEIVFTLTAIAPSDPGVTVSGQLTVRDQTRPVSFDAAVSAAGAGEVALDAEVPFNRADFGLTWNQLGMASMHSTLAIHAVFTRG